MASRTRFTGTIIGFVCLIGAVAAFTSGQNRDGWIGVILGVGIILIWEWMVARERDGR